MNDPVNDQAIKDARTIMRRIQEHLRSAHLALGSQSHSVGFVEVIHHPETALPTLNYVMPRRNTAHVPNSHIEDGLRWLQNHDRRARVCFADGLYPPMFVGGLRDLGLVVEFEVPIMVYRAAPDGLRVPLLPRELSIVPVSDQQSMGMWWYAWRNAFYDVMTTGIEPLHIGQDLRRLRQGQQLDLVLYRYGFPAGVARLTVHEGSAHIAARALLRDVASPDLTRHLTLASVQAALKAGCDLVFADGYTDEERALCREIGFIDSGSMVGYGDTPATAKAPPTPKVAGFAQPILVV